MAIHRIEFSSAKGWQSTVMTASAMECATEARAIGDAFVCTKMEPLAYAERRNRRHPRIPVQYSYKSTRWRQRTALLSAQWQSIRLLTGGL